MESSGDEPPSGAGSLLPAVRSRAAGVARITRAWAAVATASGLWLWILTTHAVTGEWIVGSPFLLVLLLLFLLPAAVLWFFYTAVRSLTSLPDDLRRLVQEGRLRSSELSESLRQPVARPRWKRAWTVFRAILELRGLLFRSKSLLVAAGMALRLRLFNPLVLAAVFFSFLASGAIVLAAAAGTLLTLLL